LIRVQRTLALTEIASLARQMAVGPRPRLFEEFWKLLD
jgi:hypothetical protein